MMMSDDAGHAESFPQAGPAANEPKTEGGGAGDAEQHTKAGTQARVRNANLPALTYSTRNHNVVEVPGEVVDAVEGFVAPPGFRRALVQSPVFIYNWGVYLVPDHASPAAHPVFRCLAHADCRNGRHTVSCKGGHRGNVNKHLASKHAICGSLGVAVSTKKGVAKSVTPAKRSLGEGATAAVAVRNGKSRQRSSVVGGTSARALETQYVRFLVKRMQPLDLAQDEEFRALLDAAGVEALPSFSAKRSKHIIAEMYDATKRMLMRGLKEEVEASPLPILHFSLDISACKVSGRKYLGVHIFWVDRAFEMHSAVLSVQPYNPATDYDSHLKAPEMLWRIFQATIDDFGLKAEDFASCTSGSDFKAMCTNFASKSGILWDWCISHIASKACEDACGTSADPAVVRNTEAQEIIRVVIEVVEKLNRSSTWCAEFDDIQVGALRDCFKIVKHSPQRWLSLVEILERVIQLWHPLQQVYSTQNELFPLEQGETKANVLQLYSLLQPVASITRDSQGGTRAMNGAMHMAMARLKTTTLCPTAPLQVFQVPHPPTAGAEGQSTASRREELKRVDVEPAQLTQTARNTRGRLLNSLMTSYYARVWLGSTVAPSFFRDAAVMLTPPFVKGFHLDHLKLNEADKVSAPNASKPPAPTISKPDVPTPARHADSRRQAIWEGIFERAVLVGRERQKQEVQDKVKYESDPKRLDTAPGSKATSLAPSSGSDDVWAMFGSAPEGDGEGEGEDEEENQVDKHARDEIERLRSIKMSPRDLPPMEALRYWAITGRDAFPWLRVVAQQTFGNQAAAGQNERDFGHAGLLLSSRRSRLDGKFAQMMLFLHANFARIPQAFPPITSREVEKCLPKSFTGPSTELEEAEAFADPDGPAEGMSDEFLNFGVLDGESS